MANRNKYVQEYYIDTEGNWELKDTYLVLKTIYTNVENLFSKSIKNGKYKTFTVERTTNSKKNIKDVYEAKIKDHEYCMEYYVN